MKKKIIVSIFLLSLISLVFYLYFNFNSIALQTTEKVATKALGVQVKIADMDIQLLDKKVTVTGIQIANPDGYEGTHIMEVDQIDIGLETPTAELINFHHIHVTGSVVNVEMNENGMNILDLKKRVETNKTKATPASNQEDPAEVRVRSAEEAIKVIIQEAAINPTTINITSSLIRDDAISVKMPTLRFRDIGKKGSAIDSGVAMNRIFEKYLANIQTHVIKQKAISQIKIPSLPQIKDPLIKDAVDVDDVENTLKGLFK